MAGLKLSINFHPLEVVNHGSKIQLQVGENINRISYQTEKEVHHSTDTKCYMCICVSIEKK